MLPTWVTCRRSASPRTSFKSSSLRLLPAFAWSGFYLLSAVCVFCLIVKFLIQLLAAFFFFVLFEETTPSWSQQIKQDKTCLWSRDLRCLDSETHPDSCCAYCVVQCSLAWPLTSSCVTKVLLSSPVQSICNQARLNCSLGFICGLITFLISTFIVKTLIWLQLWLKSTCFLHTIPR